MLYSKYLHKNIHRPISHEDSNKTLIMIMAWFCIFASIYGFRVALSKTNITMLGTDEFFDIYARGWYAHARVFSYPLLIYYIGTTTRKNVLVHITIAALFLCIAILQVKSWLIIPLLAGLLYRVASGRLRVTPVKILIFVSINYFIFNLAYLISFTAVNPDSGANMDTYLYLLRHFFGYLFAGVLGLGEQFRVGTNISGSEWSIIFAPFVNIYAVLSGRHIISQVTDYFVTIGAGTDVMSNVHTFFGTLYLFLGPIAALIYTILYSFIINLFYVYALTKRNSWLLIAVLFMISLLGVGWFEFYSWNLTSIEVPFLTIILFYLSRLSLSYGQRKLEQCDDYVYHENS